MRVTRLVVAAFAVVGILATISTCHGILLHIVEDKCVESDDDVSEAAVPVHGMAKRTWDEYMRYL